MIDHIIFGLVMVILIQIFLLIKFKREDEGNTKISKTVKVCIRLTVLFSSLSVISELIFLFFKARILGESLALSFFSFCAILNIVFIFKLCRGYMIKNRY